MLLVTFGFMVFIIVNNGGGGARWRYGFSWHGGQITNKWWGFRPTKVVPRGVEGRFNETTTTS